MLYPGSASPSFMRGPGFELQSSHLGSNGFPSARTLGGSCFIVLYRKLGLRFSAVTEKRNDILRVCLPFSESFYIF